MEDKDKPMASQPSPEKNDPAVSDAQAPAEGNPTPDLVSDQVVPTSPKSAPVEDSDAPKAAPVEAPTESPSAPKAAPVEVPARPAAPKAAPAAEPQPQEAPDQALKAAPAAAPVEPAAPVPPAPRAPVAPPAPQQPAAAPVAAPAAAPAYPTGAPVQPGASAPQSGPAPMGAYPPPPAPNAPAGNSKATVALVCGILAIVFSFIPIVGIILGIVAIVFAGKAVRMFGHSGKATGGKVCGILGIVFSVLMIVFTVVVMMIGFGAISTMDSDYDDSVPAYVSSSNESSSWSAAGAVDMDKDQQAVYDQTSALFDGVVARDSAFMAELSQEFGDEFEDSFGASYAELGIDPAAFAEWALTDFSYSIDSVFVDGDMATVYVNTSERDTFEFLMSFGDAVSTYSQSSEAAAASDAEARAKVAELFSQTMDSTTAMTTYFAALEFKKQGDAWIIDEDSVEEEFDYMFGTF